MVREYIYNDGFSPDDYRKKLQKERLEKVSNSIKKCMTGELTSLEIIDFDFTIMEANLKEMIHVKTIVINNCKINEVKNIPINCEKLNLKNNMITKISEPFPKSVTYVDLSDNYLRNIEFKFHEGIVFIDLRHNGLTNIGDIFPNSLEILFLSSNKLSRPPMLGTNIKTLDVSKNDLMSLGKLSDSLINLMANSNQLVGISNLPKKLEKLMAYKNDIKYLGPLPDTLKIVDLAFNSISVIQIIPSNVETVDLSNNKLISIGIPSDLNPNARIDLSDNPQLSLSEEVKLDPRIKYCITTRDYGTRWRWNDGTVNESYFSDSLRSNESFITNNIYTSSNPNYIISKRTKTV